MGPAKGLASAVLKKGTQNRAQQTCPSGKYAISFEAPVLKKGTDSWYLANQTLAVFLPHEWFSWVEHHDNVSGFSGLQSFWDEHDAADPKLCKNPMKGSRHLYLPLVIHGDGGQFQKWDSITIISMRSLLSADNVASSQMLLAPIPKGCQHKSENPDEDTMTVVWKVLAWSFQHLYYGKFPEFDHLGKPWPAKNKEGRPKWLPSVDTEGQRLLVLCHCRWGVPAK